MCTDWKSLYGPEPTERQRLRGIEPVSQFRRMCARLGIRIIAAGSPQATGRGSGRMGHIRIGW